MNILNFNCVFLTFICHFILSHWMFGIHEGYLDAWYLYHCDPDGWTVQIRVADELRA